MRRSLTLRGLLIWGSTGLAVLAIVGAALVVRLTSSLRSDLESSTSAVFQEEQIADRIEAAVNRQVLDATHYLEQPDTVGRKRFRADGDAVYRDLTLYLFRDLSVAERLQVERIKAAHQALEIAAQSAFELARRGAGADARAQTGVLLARVASLQRQLDRLMDMRVEDRAALRARQMAMLRDVHLSMVGLASLLVLGLLVLLRSFQRRLLPRLVTLTHTAGAIASGDYAARVAVVGQDELAEVGLSFNRMGAALQLARDELHTRNTELAATVDRLRSTQRELVQNEKLSALGGMLAGLAHELNNPLTAVLGNAELLSAELHALPGGELGRLAEELADPIAHEAVRARELVRNLLQFSRSSKMVLEAVNVGSALEVPLALRAFAFAEAGWRLDPEIEPDLWVIADAQRLQQAFLAIVNNALDALAVGGSRLRITARSQGTRVEIGFHDDGPGMAEPTRVFDPFYTTKPVGTGAGLGLTIAYRSVAEAGGSIEAWNPAAGGASFRILLRRTAAPQAGEPAAAAPPAVTRDTREDAMQPGRARPAASSLAGSPAAPVRDASVPAPPAAPSTRSRPRVLVVEDEGPVRRLQLRLLAKRDVDVEAAASAAEARDILRRRHVDAVLSDVKMPGDMDGVGLYRWVQANRPALAPSFFFVTGAANDAELAALAEERPERFMTKPFQVHEYLEWLDARLRGCARAAEGA